MWLFIIYQFSYIILQFSSSDMFWAFINVKDKASSCTRYSMSHGVKLYDFRNLCVISAVLTLLQGICTLFVTLKNKDVICKNICSMLSYQRES